MSPTQEVHWRICKVCREYFCIGDRENICSDSCERQYKIEMEECDFNKSIRERFENRGVI